MAGRARLGIAAIALGAFGAWAAWAWVAEVRAAFVGAATGPALLQAVGRPGGLPDPGSLRGQTSVALACERLLGGTTLAFQPSEVRSAVAASCLDSARSMQARAPVLAVPYLMEAQALGTAEPPSLVRAWAAAPSTGWLAERRVALALGHPLVLDAPAREALASDVLLLARSHRGATVLADLYRSGPVGRDLLVSILEHAPPEDQRRFLSRVRDAGG